MFTRRAVVFVSKMIMRYPNQIRYSLQSLLIVHNKRDITSFGSPPVWPGFAFCQDLLLNVFWQPNVAVAMPVDVHEHCSSDKKGILVDSSILPLRHTGQVENPLP